MEAVLCSVLLGITWHQSVLAPCSTNVPELGTVQAAGVHSNTLQALQPFYTNSVLNLGPEGTTVPAACTQPFISWNKAAFIHIQQRAHLCGVARNIWTTTNPPLFEWVLLNPGVAPKKLPKGIKSLDNIHKNKNNKDKRMYASVA